MDDQELIATMLYHFFPDETEIAGDSVVLDISSGVSELTRTRGGSNFDISSVIITLAAAATFGRNVLEILEKLRKKKEAKTEALDNANGQIPPELLAEIYEFLEERRKEQQPTKDES